MPVIGWILFFIVAVVVMLNSVVFGDEALGNIGLGCVVGVFICIIIMIVMIWYYHNTATGRVYKSQESNFNNGIERVVKVYDVNGQLITEYDGKFDITCDNDRILFDDENGKRHIVYYPTGTVVIDIDEK